MDHTVNLFEKTLNFYNFDNRLSDINFFKEHLRIYPTNPFGLKNYWRNTIFHCNRYNEDFIKWCLQE